MRGLASDLMSLFTAWVLTASTNDNISEIESAGKMKELEMWSDLLKVSQSSQVQPVSLSLSFIIRVSK